MDKKNVNAKLRNQFSKHFLCRFIDFSRYENNPELAKKHYQFFNLVLLAYGLLLSIPIWLSRPEVMNHGWVAILPIVYFIATEIKGVFKRKLLNLNFLSIRQASKWIYILQTMAKISVFILIDLPLVAYLAAISFRLLINTGIMGY